MQDKSVILGRIKEYCKFSTDTELADFLGIQRSTLSNWVKRNSIDYDLVFSKCENIDKNWLLTGQGEMLCPSVSAAVNAFNKVASTFSDGVIPAVDTSGEDGTYKDKYINQLEETIRLQRELNIKTLENLELKRENENLSVENTCLIVQLEKGDEQLKKRTRPSFLDYPFAKSTKQIIADPLSV